MDGYYESIDWSDDEVPVLIRFLACIEESAAWITRAVMVLDEEGVPHESTGAALEAARAALVAASRAEKLDPWWEGRSDLPPMDELPCGETSAEIIERLWDEERQKHSAES